MRVLVDTSVWSLALRRPPKAARFTRASAHRRGLSVFTSDNDLTRFQEHIPVRLHSPRFP